MKTTFEDWKRQLQRAGRFLPDGRITIDRGQPFAWGFALGGDWSAAGLTCSLKNNPDDAESVVDLTCAILDFDATATDDFPDGSTPFVVSLTAAETAGLPADEDGDFLVPFAIDFVIEVIDGDDTTAWRLMGGEAVLAGKVTDAG